jgi:DNA-binding NarL/FixJ family response regulator
MTSMAVAQRPRVIVADDHPEMRGAVTSTLIRSFDVVASAPDGAGAIEAVARLRPDAVVLDIEMPGLDGFQTAARIRATGSDARIVFLSNHVGDDFVLAGVSRGASAFVAKTCMDRDLIAAVGHALAGRAFVPSAAVLPRWRRPGGSRHDLQIYATDALLIDAVMAFFDTALHAGDSILAIVSEPHRQALEAQFAARRVDVATLERAGRYTVGDAPRALEAVLLDGVPDAALFAAVLDPLVARGLAAATGAVRHVTMYGEIAPILCGNGDFGAMDRLEQIADEYAAARSLSILCGYSTDCLGSESSELAARVCARHSTIVPSAHNL